MIKWTIGTCQYPELVGFMIYHRNRLIQPFLKVGIHKEQNTKGAGIIGIVEANQLTPTHNKQDFHDCKLYNELRKRLGESLKVVCDEKEATATTAVAQEEEASPLQVSFSPCFHSGFATESLY